jgi:AcrR family transcriptional regulator
VAVAAGTTTMAVYTHFGGKQGLVDALFREGFERMGRAQKVVPHTLDTVADLRALADAWRTAALRHPAHYQLMLGHAVPDFVPSPESQEVALAVFERLVDAVRRAMDDWKLAPAEPREVAHGLFAICHGLVGLELAGVSPGAGAADLAWRSAVDTFIRGAQTGKPWGHEGDGSGQSN